MEIVRLSSNTKTETKTRSNGQQKVWERTQALFYSGHGSKILGFHFGDSVLQEDGSWQKQPDHAARWSYTTPHKQDKSREVRQHLQGAKRGVVTGVGETHVGFCREDLDRHSGEVLTDDHIKACVKLYNILCRDFRFLQHAFSVNKFNGSLAVYNFLDKSPIPIETGSRLGQEIWQAMIEAGLGNREVFPHNSPAVWLPFDPNKIMLLSSGVVPQITKRKRTPQGMEPYQCHDLQTFWHWDGKPVDVELLVQTLEQCCRNTPDVTEPQPQITFNRQMLTADAVNMQPSHGTVDITVRPEGVEEIKRNPNALQRQHATGRLLSRTLGRLALSAECEQFYRDQNLYSGDPDASANKRAKNWPYILQHIAKTFRPMSKVGQPPTINVGKYKKWTDKMYPGGGDVMLPLHSKRDLSDSMEPVVRYVRIKRRKLEKIVAVICDRVENRDDNDGVSTNFFKLGFGLCRPEERWNDEQLQAVRNDLEWNKKALDIYDKNHCPIEHKCWRMREGVNFPVPGKCKEQKPKTNRWLWSQGELVHCTADKEPLSTDNNNQQKQYLISLSDRMEPDLEFEGETRPPPDSG